MKDVELNDTLQEEIRDFLQKTINTKQKQEEYDIFLDMIAPSLQIKVQNSIFIGVLIRNKPIMKVMSFMIQGHIRAQSAVSSIHLLARRNSFKLNDEVIRNIPPKIRQMKLMGMGNVKKFLEQIVSKASTVFATPEENIIKQDEKSTELYFIS